METRTVNIGDRRQCVNMKSFHCAEDALRIIIMMTEEGCTH